MEISEVKATIEINRAEEQRGIDIYRCIESVIAKNFQGKKLTARIEGLVKKLLGEQTRVSLIREYGSAKLSVWGLEPFLMFDKRLSFYFGSEADLDNYSVERFAESNGRHGIAAMERNAARDAILDDPAKLGRIRDCINAIYQKTAEIKALEEELRALPDGYSLQSGPKVSKG